MTTRSLILAAAAAATLVMSGNASAQEAPGRWQFRVSGGKVMPTGAQRDAIQKGNVSTAQLSWAVHPLFSVNATTGWARSRDVATEGDPKLDLFTYDIGGELRAPRAIGRTVTVLPFAGVGGGARTYNYRSLDVDATHNLAAYGSAGAELGVGRVRMRIEARDYVTGFKPLAGAGKSETRNDVIVVAGVKVVGR